MFHIKPSALLLSTGLLIGCASAVPTPTPSAAPRTLELASTQWLPFTANTGEPRVANELVELALSSDRVVVEHTIVPPDDWLAGIRGGEFDGSAAMWWSEERASYLLFSEPYLENRLVLVGRADSELDVSSFAELAGQRVGVVEGYAYGAEVDQAEGPEFVAMASTPANLRALLDGELDYVLADALFAQYSLASHPQKQDLRVGEVALVSRTLHFALRKDVPEAVDIVASFDGRVRQMLRDGTYNDVLGFGWIEADVDGDGRSDLIFNGEQVGEEAPEQSYRIVTPEKKQGPEVEFQPDYIINGERFDSWDHVPDSFKVPGAGGTNIGIGINW